MEKSKVFFDEDADISILKGKTISIIGYGNQGAAHALNFRDEGLRVIVGNIVDEWFENAKKEGFDVYTIDEAVAKGDIIYILLPDEVQPEIYKQMIESNLKPGKTLVFSSGFNIHFGLIEPPNFVDVIMEAPRMLGWGVRQRYLDKRGFPTLIAVHQDFSGKGKETVLALAKAVGATKIGAFESTFEEEAILDCFSEQGCLAGMYALFRKHFEIAVEAGYNPDIIILELWKSGEILNEFQAIIDEGIFKQMKDHSHTSQYGSLTRGPKIVTDETVNMMREILRDLQTGVFTRELITEFQSNMPVFKRLKAEALKHPINEVEERLDRILRNKELK